MNPVCGPAPVFGRFLLSILVDEMVIVVALIAYIIVFALKWKKFRLFVDHLDASSKYVFLRALASVFVMWFGSVSC